MLPSATQTTRIEYRLHSSARPCARFSSAARAAVACANPGMPAARREAAEDDQPAAAGDHRAGRDLAGELPGRVDRQPVHGAHALGRDLLGRRP